MDQSQVLESGLTAWERAGFVGVTIFLVVLIVFVFGAMLQQSNKRFDKVLERNSHSKDALDTIVGHVKEMHREGAAVAQGAVHALESVVKQLREMETRMGQEFMRLDSRVEDAEIRLAEKLESHKAATLALHGRIDNVLLGKPRERTAVGD